MSSEECATRLHVRLTSSALGRGGAGADVLPLPKPSRRADAKRARNSLPAEAQPTSLTSGTMLPSGYSPAVGQRDIALGVERSIERKLGRHPPPPSRERRQSRGDVSKVFELDEGRSTLSRSGAAHSRSSVQFSLEETAPWSAAGSSRPISRVVRTPQPSRSRHPIATPPALSPTRGLATPSGKPGSSKPGSATPGSSALVMRQHAGPLAARRGRAAHCLAIGQANCTGRWQFRRRLRQRQLPA